MGFRHRGPLESNTALIDYFGRATLAFHAFAIITILAVIIARRESRAYSLIFSLLYIRFTARAHFYAILH